MTYAGVAVNSAVNQIFHYHIPDRLQARVTYGSLVRVGFGTAMQPGIVVELRDELPPDLQDITIKPIINLLHPEPVMTEEHIELGMWMSEAYLTSPGACLWLMLPPGLTGKSTKMVHLLDESADGKNETQQKILDALHEKSPQRMSALKKVAGIKTVDRVIREMEASSLVEQESILTPASVSPKTVRTVIRNIPEDEVIDGLSRLKRSARQTKAFAYIAKYDYPLDVKEVYEAVDANSADLNALERKGLVQIANRIIYRDSLEDRDFVPSKPLNLTPGQDAVWQQIRKSLEQQMPQDNVAESGSQEAGKVPSPTLWGGDLGEGVRLPFKKWANAYASSKLYEKLKQHARDMRKSPTVAEEKLWQSLRAKRLHNIKFRRQHRIQQFIVDFYAPTINLVIEVDGESHEQQVEYDEMRTAYLEYLGLTVLRFKNEDAIQHIEGVLEIIGEYIIAYVEGKTTSTLDFSPAHQDLGEGINTFLLHGVTGSGKTEIYLHAIAEVLAQGRQAIFLVPEIAFTPQTIRRVAQRFPDNVAVVHGSLSHGERFDTWRRAREGEIGVIVGTRSALFTPLPDVGLIILDEEHDPSYKHAPPFNPPYYHAREVAEKLAEFNEATVILGSATPDLETYYRAKKGELAYVHMPDRIMGHKQRVEKQAKSHGVELAYQALDGDSMTINLPPVTVVDMREELKSGNRSMFSRDMQVALRGVLERDEQAILFLNRRGQASYVFCRDCGYVVECENCDTPLTYHRHGDLMRCHHCGHQQAAPENCPSCGSDRIRFFGAGTQQVEQAIRKEFPAARTLRWDRDTADKPELHEKILAKFANREANVMVGTQMIAKGLDLPLVTLVGVISADPGLAMPDFRAQERAFQLLTQVAGRAGRSIRGGQVVIQTYQPSHPSIQMAANHDYEGFYQLESATRRELGYPPYRRLGRILVQHTHPIESQRQIEAATEQVQHIIQKYDLQDSYLIGPAPCFFSRIDRHYRWQLLIRSSDPTRILQHIQPRNGWYIDIDPLNIL